MIRNNIVTYATTLGGALLVLVGLIGFCFPHFLWLELNAWSDLLNLAAGLVALYLGLKSTSLRAPRNFCLGLGAFYGLVGSVGWVGPNLMGLGNALFYLILGTAFVAAAAIQQLPSTRYARS